MIDRTGILFVSGFMAALCLWAGIIAEIAITTAGGDPHDAIPTLGQGALLALLFASIFTVAYIA